jgi:hypothetical protein
VVALLIIPLLWTIDPNELDEEVKSDGLQSSDAASRVQMDLGPRK